MALNDDEIDMIQIAIQNQHTFTNLKEDSGNSDSEQNLLKN